VSYTEVSADGTILGEVPGIVPGTLFRSRHELYDKKLHRALMSGIAPHGSSIVLSGGYVDDEDLGDLIIYTGEGGRDATTGRQIADQQLVRGNKALAENHLNGIPIRVHRGQAHVPDIPEGFRYRYDGLYHVARYWQERGKDGFTIWRFRLERAPAAQDAAAVVETLSSELMNSEKPGGNTAPSRRLSKITRVVRCSAVGDWVKKLHDFTCQICGTRLETPAGPYAETCHIQPLGRPHNGPDLAENVLCLCPNCHVLFDELSLWINKDGSLQGRSGTVRLDPRHSISMDALQYHRGLCGQ
jgi:putative restriction endonuclease